MQEILQEIAELLRNPIKNLHHLNKNFKSQSFMLYETAATGFDCNSTMFWNSYWKKINQNFFENLLKGNFKIVHFEFAIWNSAKMTEKFQPKFEKYKALVVVFYIYRGVWTPIQKEWSLSQKFQTINITKKKWV